MLALFLLALPPRAATDVIARVPDGIELVDDSLAFAPTGAHVAYVGERGDRGIPVVDGELGDEYEIVEPPVWDAAGEHVAFLVMETDRRGKEHWSLLYDGKEIATEDWIGPVSLSPVDGTPAYWTMHGSAVNADGSRTPGPATLFVGKKKSSKWQECDLLLPPAFSPDGRFVCTVGTKDAGWSALRFEPKTRDETIFPGGHIVEAWPQPGGNEVVYSMLDLSNGWPKEDEFHRFVIYRRAEREGRQEPVSICLGDAYESAGSPRYSPDGQRVAFRALRKGKLGVAIDDDEDAPCEFDWIDELRWDPQGERVAYVAATGCTLEETKGAQVLADMTEAKDGRWLVVHGATRSAEFDRAKLPRWSPDGERVAFASLVGKEWRVRVGERSSEACDALAAIRWADDGGSVHYGARRERELVWDVLELE